MGAPARGHSPGGRAGPGGLREDRAPNTPETEPLDRGPQARPRPPRGPAPSPALPLPVPTAHPTQRKLQVTSCPTQAPESAAGTLSSPCWGLAPPAEWDALPSWNVSPTPFWSRPGWLADCSSRVSPARQRAWAPGQSPGRGLHILAPEDGTERFARRGWGAVGRPPLPRTQLPSHQGAWASVRRRPWEKLPAPPRMRPGAEPLS